MSAAGYYKRQAEARGIQNEADVQRLLAQMTPVYDRALVRWLPQSREAAIYEAACGPGLMLRWLRSSGYQHLEGSDFSKPYVDLTRAGGFNVKLGDSIADLAAKPAQSLDAVIAIDFIEHLPKDAFPDFLRHACRALKADGCLILRAPNGASPFVGCNLFNDITHQWAYTPAALNALARLAGFARTEFVDDTLISIQHQRWWRVPLMRAAQVPLRSLIRASVREQLDCLGASYYACAAK